MARAFHSNVEKSELRQQWCASLAFVGQMDFWKRPLQSGFVIARNLVVSGVQRDLVQKLRKLIEPDPQAAVMFQAAQYENDGKRKQFPFRQGAGDVRQ